MDDDENADELSRHELRKANERDQEIRYNQSLSTADSKPQVDIEHILDNYKWDDLDNKNFPDDEPPHFSYTNYTRTRSNYVIKFDHDVDDGLSDEDNGGGNFDDDNGGDGNGINGKRVGFINEHVHHTDRMAIPEPPQQLYALGSDEAAYVWWDLEVDEEIVDTVLDDDINTRTTDNLKIRNNSSSNMNNVVNNGGDDDDDNYNADDNATVSTKSIKFPDPIVYEVPPDNDEDTTASTNSSTNASGKPTTAYSVSKINYYKKLLKQISDPGYIHVPMNNHLKNNIDIENMHVNIDINDESNFRYDIDKTEGNGARGHITSYEIRRYRLEKTGLWTLKGSTIINDEHEVMNRKYRVENLQNDYFYRFSVIPSNKRHKGNESPLSNIVKVEAPLPIHWYKVYPKSSNSGSNDKNMQFYYRHMKSGKVMHHRPDQDPKYIDETLRRLFSDAEIAYCIALFDEEIAVNEKITLEGMRSCLLAMGDVVRIKTIMRYFKHFSTDSESRFIFSFQEFMYVVYGIKKNKIDSARSSSNITCCYNIVNDIISLLRSEECYCNSCKWNSYWQPLPKPQCQHYYAQQKESRRLGMGTNEWEQIYCEILDTYVYRRLNIRTNTDAATNDGTRKKKNQSDYIFRWDAPVEVRYFMSTRLEGLLYDEFTPKEVEDFKITFNLFDADSSGFIGEEELKFWLEALGIRAPKRKVIKMIKDVDLNMNGVIEFEEFCWMYYRIHRHPLQVSKEWHTLTLMAQDLGKMVALGEKFIRTFHKPIDTSYMDVNIYRRRRPCGSATISDTNDRPDTTSSNRQSRSDTTNVDIDDGITINSMDRDLTVPTLNTTAELLAPVDNRKLCASLISQCVCIPITVTVVATKSSLQCLHWSWFARECDVGPIGELCTAFLCPFKTEPHGKYCMCGCRYIEDTGDLFYTDSDNYLSALFDLFY